MADKLFLYQFDNVQVDLASFKVWKDGILIPLEPKAFEVLAFFIHSQGRLIEKNELLDAVWRESFVTPNALTRVIAQLRKGLGDDAKEARYIETVPTRGYRFIAEVKSLPESHGRNLPAPTTPLPTPSAPADSLPPVSHRKAGLRWSVAASALVLLVVLVIFWAKRGAAEDWVSVRRTVQITASPLIDLYPAFSPDGAALAYSTIRNGSFEIAVKPLTPGSKELVVTTDGMQNLQPTWSPDGKQIAFHSRQRGGIWVIPALGGVAQQLVEFGAYPAWSPDGNWIVFQSDAQVDLNQTAFAAIAPSTLWIVAATGGTARQLTHKGTPLGGHGAPAWSPDGQRIVFVSYALGQSEIWTVTREGQDLRLFSGEPVHVYDPVFAPDGNHLFWATNNGNFQLWRRRIAPNGEGRGEAEEVANTGAALARYLTIAPDGKRIAYSSLMLANNLGSVAVDPTTGAAVGTPTLLTQDTNQRKTSPVFSPDGTMIVYNQWRTGAGGELWLMDATGQNPRQLSSGLAGLPNWLPGGREVAVVTKTKTDCRMRAIEIATGKQTVLSAQELPRALGKLSPDGKFFAFNFNRDGAINVATIALAGGEPQQVSFDAEMIGFPCWSPDSQWLAAERKRGDDTQIVVLPRTGGTPEQITSEPGQSWPGGWAKDQDRIAFAGQRNGLWNVYWVSRRTKKQTQLTQYTKPNSYVRYPVWSPQSNQVVYEYGETTGNVWMVELK